MKKTLLSFVAMMVVFCMGITAQVTTSGLSGHVSDASGAPMVGAAVVVVHTPSGTEYAAVTDAKGQFRLVNLRSGGPYDVKTQMLGFKTVVSSGIMIALGETYVVRQTMSEKSQDLDAVVVTSVQNSIMNSERTGAVTNISQRQIENLPTTSRSISDFVRLTPQAGNNSTFGGRDTRYNNIMIDGAQLANRFGLQTTNIMPGGDAQPISLDAIQEISVSLTPYDVRQSNFTGANINAVTKSGTNEFAGSAYAFLRPKSFTGDHIGDRDVPNANSTSREAYGLTFGGPIIKNKLFFFVTGEIERTLSPGNLWRPSTNGTSDKSNYISRASASDLQKIHDFFLSQYGYEAGSFNNNAPNESKNHKIVARLDWNINRNHKAMLRYNEVVSSNYNLPSNTSSPYNVDGLGRNSVEAISFYNAGYMSENTVRSITGELNSHFSDKISNKFLATYSNIIDPKRKTLGKTFPFIDIFKKGATTGTTGYAVYTSLGTELYSQANQVGNKSLTITDNVTFSLGAHTLTAGLSFEHEYFDNGYLRGGTTYYAYRWDSDVQTIDQFLSGFDAAQPTYLSYQLPFPGGTMEPRVNVTFALASAYLQDEWRVSERFNLTAGLRIDKPIYITDLEGPTYTMNGTNKVAISDIEFLGGQRIDLMKWGSKSLLFSPRVGFNWDVLGDRSLQVRGGSGIFTGFMPFVWFTNQPGCAGFLQTAETRVTNLSGITFDPDYMAQIFDNPKVPAPTSGVTISGSNFAKVADDFKLPQLWRSSLAVDIQLPESMILTLEGTYSKDLNAIMQRNINLDYSNDDRYTGPDNRMIIKDKKVPYVNTMMVLENTDKGYQATATAQLTKTFSNGLSGMLAYTYTQSKDVGNNPGSAARSAYVYGSTTDNPNDPELSFSSFAVPHRVVGYISYEKEWLCNFRSTFSLYYSGMHMGRVNYIFAKDMLSTGNSTYDMIYIPRDVNEMGNIVDNVTKLSDGTTVTYKAEDQRRDFDRYISNNSYLDSRRGKYAERFGGLQPWLNRFDFKFIQDIYTRYTHRPYAVQFTLDILNVGNLINSKWGVYKTNGFQSYENCPMLAFNAAVSDGNGGTTYNYKLNATSSKDFWSKAEWKPDYKTTSVWGIQMGFRVKF